MNHLDEAVLVGLRDGEEVSTEERLHGEECASCGEALRAATRRTAAIDRLLAANDYEVDVEAAKAAVRSRLDVHRAGEGATRFGFGYRSLRRAAAILLLTAGAAYALPRTGVLRWVGLGRTSEPEATTVGPVGSEPDATGVEVAVAGGLDIVLDGVEAGSEVELVWIDGPMARISAGPGSTYSVANGRAEARVVGGPVVVELPRSEGPVSITIDGRTVFDGDSSSSRVSDVVRRSTERIVFRAPRG